MLTYVAVGWIIRSFYWNTIDQEMAYEVIEGKIAMELIKPVSVQGMWLARAMGESAFRLILLTVPAAAAIALIFPVQRLRLQKLYFALFLAAVLASFLLMGALSFLIGTCAIPLNSILSLIRAKFWLIDLLSGLLIPIAFFPQVDCRSSPPGCPSSTSPTRRCKFISASSIPREPLRAVGNQLAWVALLLWAGHLWWNRAVRKITIHGG